MAIEIVTETLSGPLALIRQHARAYAYLNFMAYGLLIAGMVLGALRPELNEMLTGSMDESGETGLVVSLLARPWLFALVILGVNLGKVALGFITLPSMIVPFAGIPVFGSEQTSSGGPGRRGGKHRAAAGYVVGVGRRHHLLNLQTATVLE